MKKKTSKKYLLIYNPQAGKKRKTLDPFSEHSLEDIKELLQKHKLDVDVLVTKRSEDAYNFAKRAVSQKYDVLITAGGDGTVGEAINGIVGSSVVLGILPLGTFMNVSRMIEIPENIEKAVAMIKHGNVRKVDVGAVVRLDGKKARKPYYFLESAGVGFEAEMIEHFEKLDWNNLHRLVAIGRTIRDYYAHKTTVTLDKKEEIITKANMITVSNGAYTGPAVKLAPQAKLNDHTFTVAIYKMSKWALLGYFFRLIAGGSSRVKEVSWYQAREVSIVAKSKRMIQADARIFGSTPATFALVPNALSVITGVSKRKKYLAGKE